VQCDPRALADGIPPTVYDEPEFIVHNIWRLYGGWWTQPATLKPANDRRIALE